MEGIKSLLPHCRRPVNPGDDADILAEVFYCIAEDIGLPYDQMLQSLVILLQCIRTGMSQEESIALSIKFVDDAISKQASVTYRWEAVRECRSI